jgi:DNA-binding response OmpR family regulator
MLTAKTGQWDIVEGLDLGADDYLTKPFSMAVLLARVRARTRGVGTAARSLRSGDLRLDTTLHRCWRGDAEIELTGRETKLLGELFRRGGEVIAKADLLRLVWGGDFHGDPNVVEVYVGRLRRKIDTPFATNDIETVRNVGYRLRTPDVASQPA